MKETHGFSFYRRRSWQKEKVNLLSRKVYRCLSSPSKSPSKLPFPEDRLEDDELPFKELRKEVKDANANVHSDEKEEDVVVSDEGRKLG